MSTLLDSATVTARKAHRCDQCSRAIQPGERYERQKSINDYGFDTWRSCIQCWSLAQDLWMVDERGEDPETGADCLASLPYVDWPNVRLWSPLWARRADLYAQRWAGQPYPVADPTYTHPITVAGQPAEERGKPIMSEQYVLQFDYRSDDGPRLVGPFPDEASADDYVMALAVAGMGSSEYDVRPLAAPGDVTR